MDLGADVLVDRQDPSRAIEIIRNVTKGNLRFALDTVGKESATHLQESLRRPQGDKQAHLVTLTGLPKVRLPGVKYHKVPIKVFHTVPAIGENVVTWLEELLIESALQPPEVVTANGGLEAINGALDQLRNGNISGKRLVVPIGRVNRAELNGYADKRENREGALKYGSFEFADKLNADPSRVKFA